jgi:hypothetical protein
MSNTYEDWLTKQEAARTLGIAEKTLDRLASRGQVEKRTRKRPGQPFSSVFNPSDIERLAAQDMSNVSDMSRTPALVSNTERIQDMSDMSDMSRFVEVVAALAERIAPRPAAGTLYINIEDAARLAGLNVRIMRKAIKAGRCRAARLKLDGKVRTVVCAADLPQI